MEIHCPNCQHKIKIKTAKPGDYEPECPKCRRAFRLTVPDDGSPPRAEPSPESVEATLAAADATVPDEVEATGAWGQSPTMTASPEGHATVAEGAGATLSDGASSRPHDVPATLGGYQILRELGRGAMGAVYLARQVSLDRHVALKVIQSRLADNPTFIARFTREAYAAAQLVHPNVVQIYDLGRDGDTYFFSMEFVEGETLSSLIQREGKLDAETALRYTLQAARGLKFAHDQGMVHRDVKPDNLLLSQHGVVKVADLGLVKSMGGPAEEPGVPASSESLAALRADITEADVAMGTPSYMAPEQAEDAAGVDHRADIYSLGCTLYVLLTGRPPFSGDTALDVISKHKSEPVMRPETVVKEIPTDLSEINMRMVAKRPEDRYSDLGEAIEAIEKYLGLQSKGPFLPEKDHLSTLEKCAGQFYKSLTAGLRSKLALLFLAVCVVVFLGAMAFSATVAGGALGLAVMTPLAYFVLSGTRERSHLFVKVRQFILGGSWGDWAAGLLGLVLAIGGLWAFGLLWIWLGVAVVAIGVAAGFHFVIDGKINRERAGTLEEMQRLFKAMRLAGIDEHAIREFVATYSGSRWEEFFEALFGYEAKLAAREQWAAADEGRRRDRFRAWRDPLIRWIDARLQARREAKDRQHLQRVEEEQLKAQGLKPSEARQRAEQAAAALVNGAAEIRRGLEGSSPAGRANETPEQKRARVKAMLAAAQTDTPQSLSSKAALGALNLAIGPKARFLAGAVLLAAFFLWMQQHELFPDRDKPILGQLSKVWQTEQPLHVPMVPVAALKLVSGVEAGVAGLILVFSSFFSGFLVAALAIPSAALALLTPLPGIVFGPRATSVIAATALAVVGFFLGRRGE